jgi:hypothetical protein
VGVETLAQQLAVVSGGGGCRRNERRFRPALSGLDLPALLRCGVAGRPRSSTRAGDSGHPSASCRDPPTMRMITPSPI